MTDMNDLSVEVPKGKLMFHLFDSLSYNTTFAWTDNEANLLMCMNDAIRKKSFDTEPQNFLDSQILNQFICHWTKKDVI